MEFVELLPSVIAVRNDGALLNVAVLFIAIAPLNVEAPENVEVLDIVVGLDSVIRLSAKIAAAENPYVPPLENICVSDSAVE